MHHTTVDAFKGNRTRLDNLFLIYELLEEIPVRLQLQPVAPPFLLPYYNRVGPADCGVSAFVFLLGGHLTLHTFSVQECLYVDLLYPEEYDQELAAALVRDGFRCAEAQVVEREREQSAGPVHDTSKPKHDFGPHLLIEFDDIPNDLSFEKLFRIFDEMPFDIGMTPIMRPSIVLEQSTTYGKIVSAMTMIAESHISLHLFPDRGRAYFDLFSCRFFDCSDVVERLSRVFGVALNRWTLVSRGQNLSRKTLLEVDKADYPPPLWLGRK
jgi:S-adenosylmethionine/arginine decarboxylase-like enzyme